MASPFSLSYRSTLKKLELAQPQEIALNENISPEEIKKLETDYYSFVMEAWHLYQPNVPFRHGYHLKVISEHIEELYYGRISKLIINIPPGFGKSSLGGVFLCPWTWTTNPGDKFFYTGSNYSLVERDSVFSRDIIESEWYRERWGDKVVLKDDSNTKKKFGNTEGGVRVISSVGGRVTGVRTNWSIMDDPNDSALMESKVYPVKINNWADRGMSTRLDITGIFQRWMLIQQRFDAIDVTGHYLSKDDPGMVHLFLPMEFIPHRRCITVPVKSTFPEKWQDPRQEKDDLLWPDVFDAEKVRNGKIGLGSVYAVSGQYQQTPSPDEGGIIDVTKFRMWKSEYSPSCEYILQSWDTAMTEGDDSSCSAMTCWGIFRDHNKVKNVILLSMWVGKKNYPDLKRFIRRLSDHILDTDFDHPNPIGPPPTRIIMEAKASGLPFIQDLRENGVLIQPFNPNQQGIKYPSKRRRAEAITPLIEAGMVWLPGKGPDYNCYSKMSARFIEECAIFDKGEYDDLVDTMSQAFITLNKKGELKDISNPERIVRPDFSNVKRM